MKIIKLIPIENSDKVFLTIDDKYFEISAKSSAILEGYFLGLTPMQIAAQQALIGEHLDEDKVNHILHERLLPTFNASESLNTIGDIKFKHCLIKANQIDHFLGKLKCLFHKPIFYILLALGLLTTILFYALTTVLIDRSQLRVVGMVLMPFLFAIMFLHEVGHAAAAKKFGAQPGDIGIGFYFFTGVLYADVTDIWRLCPSNRIVVNLAGVLMQLLVNIMMIVAFVCSSAPTLYVLITLNTMSIVTNLIPFFKLDGYWVVSDLLNAKRLDWQANQELLNLLNPNKKEKRYLLVVYATLKYLLMALGVIFLIRFIIAHAKVLQSNGIIETFLTSPLKSILFVVAVGAFLFKLLQYFNKVTKWIRN